MTSLILVSYPVLAGRVKYWGVVTFYTVEKKMFLMKELNILHLWKMYFCSVYVRQRVSSLFLVLRIKTQKVTSE